MTVEPSYGREGDGFWMTVKPSYGRERVNNMSNYVQVPTHISGHILDLVLTPVGVDLVNWVEVSPIDHKIFYHALITFELDVIELDVIGDSAIEIS